MNFTESFSEFSSKLTTMDLALYAGVGIVLWVLFKDKLSPVQKLVSGLIDQIKSVTTNTKNTLPVVEVPKVQPGTVNNDDTFFKLVVSWKQTRDLAEKSGCGEAVKVADQMFPYLSPNVCAKKELT
jgi:hypothetical protein